jgi:hypothetical protein
LYLDLKWSDPRNGIEVRVEGGYCGLSLAGQLINGRVNSESGSSKGNVKCGAFVEGYVSHNEEVYESKRVIVSLGWREED